ncbi:UdgX family uracil-DNA binding protein [soil metagenome]
MQSLPLYPTLEAARLAAQDCTACQRCADRQQVVFGSGNPQASLMLVGEAPSATDDDTGKPFSGPAGRLLDQLFSKVGLHRNDVWITNLTRCFSGRERNGRIENRPAAAREIDACATWMDMEIRYVNPSVILAVGAPPAKRLIDRNFRLQEQRGVIFQRSDGSLVIATIQPAYVMRLPSLVDKAASDIAREQLLGDIRLAARNAGLISD